MEVKEFFRQLDLSNKEHDQWEKRAQKVIDRYRQEKSSGSDLQVRPAFNILWANTEVMRPSLFSQTPKPDIRRRYRDDDPVAKQGARVIERSLEFIMDPEFYDFGIQSVMDYLLPGRTVSKVRYLPLYAKTRHREEVSEIPQLSELGEQVGSKFFLDDDEVDPSEVQFDERGSFLERDIEEVVDESVEIGRWPWKNFRHQKAKRWEDVGWIDYISFLDRKQLVKLFGKKRGNEIKMTVDASGSTETRDGNPTHAEVHEVWFKASRKVKLGIKGDEKTWGKEGGDPLRLVDFYPTARPVMPINTNDSLRPIPLFTLYQHQANELDIITQRIAVLMKSIKVVGLYAGNEKDILKKLFEADENQMVPVEDWMTFAQSGGVSKLIDWMPVDQAAKVLTGLFAEREQIVQQIFELTGLADIQRGVSDPRETKGAQVLKAQFGSQRNLTPKQEIERYFRDTLRIAAEIASEHFSADTLQRMTGLEVPPQVKQMLEDDLLRAYSIDIETDSTVAPDEERDKAEMANALEAVSGYLTAVFPITQAGIPAEPLIKLLKTYLRKFRWGREMEETLEEIERNPPPPKPDPEAEKAKAEMEMKQQEQQMQMQIKQAEFQLKQQLSQIDMQAKVKELEIKAIESQQDLRQDQQDHVQELRQDREKHLLEIQQLREKGKAMIENIKAQAAAKPDAGQTTRAS